ncbi:MAG: LacI family DNA-binding transcriptional regulator [Clostridiales bacterium]|nr:LacI family transcriptional regulator [Roseburia sp.]MDD7636722.1 LacI family DNA-binding transcriptional regulator [Clostridiales bacterium]MDY4111703.1 LacI family DNA-binding transcriptional regulator [Roseburia sp.]
MRKVTIKDVAMETGLSIATVSYVMSGKKTLPPETVKLVTDAIDKLGYVKNYSASSLVSNKSNLIGVVIPQTEPGSVMVFGNPFYSEMLSSIEYNARIRGYHVIVSGTNADEKYFQLAKQRNLDGVIVIGAYSEDFYEGLNQSRVPIVLVDSYLENHIHKEVKLDDVRGGYLATRYLIEHGHKKIAFLSGKIKVGGVNEQRYEGYVNALTESGILLENKYVFHGNVDFESARRMAERIATETDCTAIFATADIIAVGVIKELNSMHIKVPEQMSVIGFDNLNIADYCTPGLTTIGQNIFEKGKMAVELLCKTIEEKDPEPEKCLIPITIVERESVANR